jgi:hypothetical protein
MARYLLVRGVHGKLVANPAGWETRRFLGKKPNGVYWKEGPIDPETNLPRWPAAVVCEEVCEDDLSIRKAIKAGEIILVRECIADNLGNATLMLAAAESKKAPTRAEVK